MRGDRRSTRHLDAASRLPEGEAIRRPRSLSVNSLELISSCLQKAQSRIRASHGRDYVDRDDGESKSPPNINIGRDYLTYVGATPLSRRKAAIFVLMRLLRGQCARIR